MDLTDLAFKFGLPTALLVAAIVFAWRVFVWLKPWAEKLIQAHLNLVNVTSSAVDTLKVAMEQLAATQEQQAKLLVSIEEKVNGKKG